MMQSATSPSTVRLKRARFVRQLFLLWPSFVIVFGFVAMAVLAPVIAPYAPNHQDLLSRLRPPGYSVMGKTYLLGTDQLGRDLLTRIIFGTRVSLVVASLSVMVSMLVGVSIGMVSGYYRGWVETILMRLVDIVLSIPALLLAIITVAVLGPGLKDLILVLGFTRWPRYARVAYGQTLSVMNRPYIEAQQALGSRAPRVLFKHVFPNILGPILVVATLEFGLMVLFEAGLSFLGLGVQPPTASWGSILSVGREYVSTAWWIATFPGICLFLLVLAINIVGDYLPERLDPRSEAGK